MPIPERKCYQNGQATAQAFDTNIEQPITKATQTGVKMGPESGIKKNGRVTEAWLLPFFLLSLLICQVAGCATTAAPPPAPQSTIARPESRSLFDYPADDRKIFDEGLACLKSTPEQPADYTRARNLFEMLVQQHPDSKWRLQAETWLDHLEALSRLEEQLKACRQSAEAGQNEHSRLQREIEQLRLETRQAREKSQEELNRLTQENEQLKRDLRLLKNLDIQQEKRERMLR